MNVCPGYLQVYKVRTQSGEAKTLGGDEGGADTEEKSQSSWSMSLKGSPHWTGYQAVCQPVGKGSHLSSEESESHSLEVCLQ